jgi:hypothetical protein
MLEKVYTLKFMHIFEKMEQCHIKNAYLNANHYVREFNVITVNELCLYL